jgi:mannose-6-phosphate isomerase-like protein (cupin superfamily)
MLIINRDKAKIIETPHNSEIRPLIDRTTSTIEKCSLAEEILPIGAAVGKHFHKKTEEIYYILKGSGEMTVGDETRIVVAGDAIFIPREYVHTLKNTGTEPIKLLLICGAAHDFADYFIDQTNG